MSSFICSDKHIVTFVVGVNLLLHAPVPQEELQKQADLLLKENIRSVNWRYNECTKNTTVVFDPAVVQLAENYSPADLVRLGDCIDYQCCDHPKWKTTKGHHLLMTLQNHAYYHMVNRGLRKSEIWSI